MVEFLHQLVIVTLCFMIKFFRQIKNVKKLFVLIIARIVNQKKQIVWLVHRDLKIPLNVPALKDIMKILTQNSVFRVDLINS